MVELKEKANNYAEENFLNILKESFAKVYADGYRDGYRDREEEIPVDLRNDETEYVDLGLPSGTLWAADYKKSNGYNSYLPYCQAECLQIPTKEQWEELINICKCEYKTDKDTDIIEVKFIGPNGAILRFVKNGKIISDDISDHWHVYFWLKDQKEGNEKSAIHLYRRNQPEIIDVFSGYKLPIRLVRPK